MKKCLVLLCLFLFLQACTITNKNQEDENHQVYLDLLELVKNNDKFKQESEVAKVTLVVQKVKDGYRHDIIVEEPLVGMYRVKAIAVFEGVDHENTMAANFGIFDSNSYNLIPNQFHKEKFYIKGFVMSVLSDHKMNETEVLLQWQNADNSETFKEFIQLKGADNE